MSIKLTIIHVRHGLSCTNVIQAFAPEEFKWNRYRYRDPELTSRSLDNIKTVEAPGDVDAVFSSTMIRAQETALHLYPNRTITLVPFMREIGDEAENTISESHFEQKTLIGEAMSNRIDPQYVVDSNDIWTKDAYKTDYNKWLQWISKWVRQQHKKTGKKSFKILVTTHSSLMMKVFNLQERPNNICMISSEYKVTKGKIRSDGHPHKIIFEGIPQPSYINFGDVKRCRMHQF